MTKLIKPENLTFLNKLSYNLFVSPCIPLQTRNNIKKITEEHQIKIQEHQ